MRKISVALLQEFCTKRRQSSLCTLLKHMGIGVTAPPILELSTAHGDALSALRSGCFPQERTLSKSTH
jgi:hypothetical protein